MSQITQAELDDLRVNFGLQFQDILAGTPVFYKQFCTEVPSTGHSNVYGWTAAQLRMRKWIGPRMVQNLSEHKFVVENEPFELTVEMDKDRLDDDRGTIGVFSAFSLKTLAEAAAKHPDDLFVEKLQSNSGAGPLAFDGENFFANAHPNYNETGTGATTYDNLFALALDKTNFNTVWSTMVSYIGENGRPLNVLPDTLIVPPQLKLTALEIMQSTTYGQGSAATNAIDNVMKGWANVVVLPELAGDPTRWYVADLSKSLKPFGFQKRSAPTLTARDQLTDPKVFEEKVFTYGADYRGAVFPTLPFLMATSKP